MDVCPNGHPRTPGNIYVEPNGKRKCRECHRLRVRRHPGHRTGAANSWRAMQQRCLNPNHTYYRHYGGRGITICERWVGPDGFANFLADMGERPPERSLDRIDNSGNYEPGNCRWATRSEQMLNRRAARVPA